MTHLTVRGRSRTLRLLLFAVVLGLVGSLASIQLGPVQKAAAADPATPGWYMIVSDYYNGTPGHGDGQRRCLSTSGEESTSGAGTHRIYLAPCSADSPSQWWRLLSVVDWKQLRNWQQADGLSWCLSGNQTSPPGTFSNTHGAYTSPCRSATVGQYWNWYKLDTNLWNIRHYLGWSDSQPQWLQTTSSLPYSGSRYQVFTTNASYEGAWRLAPGTPPPCGTCG